jgi:hypothetical protein
MVRAVAALSTSDPFDDPGRSPAPTTEVTGDG